MANLEKIITELTAGLSVRQKEILDGRFGLIDSEEKTLQELGEKYGITRERVRQIEAEGLRLALDNFKKSEGMKVVEEARKHLEIMGGVRGERELVEDLKGILKNEKITKQQIRFIFEIAKEPLYFHEDEDFNSFWYLDKNILKKVSVFIDKSLKHFSNKKEELVFKNEFPKHFEQVIGNDVSQIIGLNYLSISKKFSTNSYNDFGLSHWEEINPKTARAKSYLVLKKEGKPLHFRDIAKVINNVGFDNKPVYAQTIHNELIKDNRFVLVGRGIYGLKEHGFFPGTAKDVIKSLIKEKGPLNQNEIIELVSAQRFLKENTIVLNLQNKKHFKKNDEGKYYLA